MNSFNSMKNGSGVINQVNKQLQNNKDMQNVYIYGDYNSYITFYDKRDYAFGTPFTFAGGDADAFIVKYDSNGMGMWRTRIGGSNNSSTEFPKFMIMDSSKNIYISGTYGVNTTVFNRTDSSFATLTNSVGSNIFIVKYNSNGMGQWSTKVDGDGDLYVKNMIMDSSDNVYISGQIGYDGTNISPKFYNSTGTNFKTISRQNMSADMFIAKYNSSGDVLWVAKIGGYEGYNGGGSYTPVNMLLDSSNNICISGYMSSQYSAPVTFYNSTDTTTSTFKQLTLATGQDTFIAKYNRDGSGIWATLISMNTSIQDSVQSIDMNLDSSNNVYISYIYSTTNFGTLTLYNSNDTSFNDISVGNNIDTLIAKYYSNGMVAWATKITTGNEERITNVITDSLNNVYISGYYSSGITLYHGNNSIFKSLAHSGGTDIFIAKYNTDGSGIWATRIAGTGSEQPVNMILDSSNNLYITGFYGATVTLYDSMDIIFNTLTTAGFDDTFIAKYTSNGIGLWVAKIGGAGNNDQPISITLDSVNNLYITGTNISDPISVYNGAITNFKTLINSGGNDTFVANYDSDGSTLWATRIAGTGTDQPVNMISDTANNVYVSGYYTANVTLYNSTDTITSTFKTLTNAGGNDTFLAKYGSNGIGAWATRISGIGTTDQPVNMIYDTDNNVYISGYYNAAVTLYNSTDTITSTFKTLTNLGGNDIFVAKYNRDGSGIWATRIAGTGSDVPVNLLLDSANNVYVSGYYTANLTLYNSRDTTTSTFKTLTKDGSTNTFISKYNSDGSGIWATHFGSQLNMSVFGNTWVQKMNDANRNWYSVAMSSSGQYQTAAILSGLIYISTDSGNTWFGKDISRGWTAVAVSSTGQYQTAVAQNDYIYLSSDTGNTWVANTSYPNTSNPRFPARTRSAVAMSSSGRYQTVGGGPNNVGIIATSNDYGNTWVEKITNQYTRSIAISSTGQYQTVAVNDNMFVSNDYGDTWTVKLSGGNGLRNVAMSSTGQYQTVVGAYNNYIYTSSDSGNTWVANASATSSNLFYVAMTSDGKYQTAVAYPGYIYTSSDTGNTWVQKMNDANRNWYSVAMSSSGEYQTALVFDGYIYTSSTTSNGMINPVNLTLDSANNVYISGYYNGEISFYNNTDTTTSSFKTLTNAGGNDTFIAKYDSNGIGVWATRISDTSNNQPVNLLLDSANNVCVSGYYSSNVTLYNNTDTTTSTFKTLTNAGNTDTFIAKYNSSGIGVYATQISGTKNNIDKATFGTTWVNKTGFGNKSWTSVSLSSTGEYQAAAIDNGYITISSDYGVNWIERTSVGSKRWYSISISSTGMYQSAVVQNYGANQYIYTSSNYGVNWIERTSAGSKYWYSISLSSTGMYQTAVAMANPNPGYINTSSNYGVNWIERTAAGNKYWRSVSLSSTGEYQTVLVNDGNIHRSSDYGVNWIEIIGTGPRTWYSVSLSSTGEYQTAVSFGTYIFTSNNYGVTWVQKTATGTKSWSSVSLSSTGEYQIAVVNNGPIYRSLDYGVTWSQITDPLVSNIAWISISMSSYGEYQTALLYYGSSIYTSKSNILASVIQPVNMILDSANNVYVSGYYNSQLTLYNSTDTTTSSFKTLNNAGDRDTFIAKYNSNGIGTWATRISDTSNNQPINMILDLANNVYVSGYYSANLTLYDSRDTTTSSFKTLTNAGGIDTFIAKYNSDGSGIWVTRLTDTGNNNPVNMILNTSNNIYISGYYNSQLTLYNNNNNNNLFFKNLTHGTGGGTFIAKYNTNGTAAWAAHIVGNNTPKRILIK